ncbi:MAG: hypothetical protein JNL82_17470 [Myxococcales bacterium]|nr:hypothetical protein [Myxococcales bacterium]
MKLLDRHRVTRLIELADLERRVAGPERLLREEDVSLFIKAAYDDASDAARAEFLTRVKPAPTSAWPWSAVQAATPRGGGRGGIGGIVFSPAPGALAPAALILVLGQVDTIDADPGNRIPDRGGPEGAAWEPLYKALDLWDTATIKKWIAPQGWMTTSGTMAGQTSGGGVNIGGETGNGGVNPGGGQTGTGGMNNGNGQPDAKPPPPAFSWRHPAVLVAGATALTTVGVTLYALRQSRQRPAPAPTTKPPLAAPSPATATAAPTNTAPTAGPPAPAATAASPAKEST